MSKLKIMILVLFVVGLSAAAYWFNQNPPGVTMIDPARPDSGTSRSGKDPHVAKYKRSLPAWWSEPGRYDRHCRSRDRRRFDSGFMAEYSDWSIEAN